MTIEKAVMDLKVIGKQEGTKGLIFKKPKYVVAFQVVDPMANANPTMEREVSFHQYSAVEVGDVLPIALYTPNGRIWYFSREEAEWMG